MILDKLHGRHVGSVVLLEQSGGPARVELVGVLAAYELHWTNDQVVYAWLVIGGREHRLENAADVARTTVEVLV